ncbi:MAG: tRNA guanosine(34) transglycosylase Tgt [Candidatus Buchananbacteria bacterium]|nr:tRNA guanosine(34) transglycosylase Tgt [Candidatus Buchananbacteria bacterium]
MLKILKESKKSAARLTKLKTAHGDIMGPFFMPIATKAAVKNLSTPELKNLKAEIILSNTYHLMLAPGSALIKKAGGLHQFMSWPGPILTDSGGFQVFSLSRLRQVKEDGVMFSDPKSGAKHFLTPEKSISIQQDLGVDIMMAFDDVIGYPATKKQVKESMQRTSRWAKRCKTAHQNKTQLLFGIVQGGVHKDLRQQSLADLLPLDFDGYAIGGVAVGEPRNKMKDILNWTVPHLPKNKPRYLMGLGKPEEIVAAVKQGIDMFDCVIPTREARHGRLYLWHGKADITKKNFYTTINITNAKFIKDFKPVNDTSLKGYSRAYLNHLFKTQESLALRLATINNLEFYLSLMAKIRKGISDGKL